MISAWMMVLEFCRPHLDLTEPCDQELSSAFTQPQIFGKLKLRIYVYNKPSAHFQGGSRFWLFFNERGNYLCANFEKGSL